jgi:hypothetical protein
MEITDTGKMTGLQTSVYLRPLVKKWFPHPIRFHQVWNQQRGGRKFYAWRAVPPSSAFIAMGMVGTTDEDPPSVECMRCVPMAWVKPTTMKPKLLWDDSGTGGRRGSVWLINSLNLIAVVQGHEAPKETFYEFQQKRFFMSPNNKKEIEAFIPEQPADGAGAPATGGAMPASRAVPFMGANRQSKAPPPPPKRAGGLGAGGLGGVPPTTQI